MRNIFTPHRRTPDVVYNEEQTLREWRDLAKAYRKAAKMQRYRNRKKWQQKASPKMIDLAPGRS